MTEYENVNPPAGLAQQNESVEVTRNTKGYSFTVKILSTDLVRIKQLTDELNKLYPRETK